MLRKLVPLLLPLLGLGSCDVPGYILIQNKSAGRAVYRYHSTVATDSSQSYAIKLPGSREQEQIAIPFGFGWFWTNERIQQYVNKTQAIDLISPTDSSRLMDKKQLVEFFRKRRRGVFKQEIRIIIR